MQQSLQYDCPATAFKEKCRGDACPEWIHVTGKHPQTGVPVDMFDCARRWMPILLIQFSKEISGVASSVDSARNEARLNAAGVAAAVLRQPNMFRRALLALKGS